MKGVDEIMSIFNCNTVPTYFKHNALENMSVGEKITIKGICNNTVIYIEESSFGVFNFETENMDYFKIQGTFTDELVSGLTYQMNGKVVEYKGEKQLRVYDIITSKPVNKKGIISYLKTLYGLKSKAEIIYDVFGDDCIDILIKTPMVVCQSIKGIGKKSVLKWQDQLQQLKESQEVYIKLLGYGLSSKNISKLLEKYGEGIVTKIEVNPYMLSTEVKGYGFLKCDKIAMDMGALPNDPNRIRCGVLHALEDFSLNGHCYAPKIALRTYIKNLLDLKLDFSEMNHILQNNSSNKKEVIYTKYQNSYKVDIDKLQFDFDRYIASKKADEKNNFRYTLVAITQKEIDIAIKDLEKEKQIIIEDGRIYLPHIYYAEVGFAKKIKRLAKYTPKYTKEQVESVLNKICKEKGYVLEREQKKACIEFNLAETGVYILRGSAGTGKTFTLNLILEVAKRLKSTLKEKDILVVAPTGKASKVASKSIGMEGFTIHRALCYNGYSGFEKDENDPFIQNTTVCDEGSMLDIELGYSYVRAIKDNAKLIIMGDTHQLPSIGAGNVLHDLIESNLVKVVTLNVIKRQGVLSGIVNQANRIIDSQMIFTEETSRDFFMLKREGIKSIQATTVESVKRILKFPNKYTLDDIQILLPQRTGALGVNMFNYIMQKEFNSSNNGLKVLKTTFEAKETENDIKPKEFSLYIKKNDKVMHIKNNYNKILYSKNLLGGYEKIENKLGITNGECGIVEDIVNIPKKGLTIIVKYDDYYVFYDDGIDELELCYATTIHKSQGSAWRAIIMPIAPQHSNMLSNNLIYTGVTRAREFIAVIGNPRTIFYGINKHTVIERYTSLKERLIA